MRTPNLNFIYVKQRVCAPLGRTIYELLAPKSTLIINITSEIASDLMKVKSGAFSLFVEDNMRQKGGIQLCH